MRYITGIALLMAVLAGFLVLNEVLGLQDNLVAATSGATAKTMGFLGYYWLLIVAVLVVLGFVGTLAALFRR